LASWPPGARNDAPAVRLALAEPQGFDGEVLAGLRGLVAPADAVGVALAATSELPGVADAARLCAVLLRDGTVSSTATVPGGEHRRVPFPSGQLGGFLRRVVGLPSQLEHDAASTADVASRVVLSRQLARLRGDRPLTPPTVREPVDVVCSAARLQLGWDAVLAELRASELAVTAPDAPSVELMMTLAWADAGTVAVDVDAMVASWGVLESRWSALSCAPEPFFSAQFAAMARFYARPPR
jgi:hypothetical protein